MDQEQKQIDVFCSIDGARRWQSNILKALHIPYDGDALFKSISHIYRDAITRIDNLSIEYNYPIPHWDLSKVFMENGKFITDTRKIGVIFRKKMNEEKKAGTPAHVLHAPIMINICQKDKEALKNIEKEFGMAEIDRRITTARKNYSDYMKSAMDYASQLTKYLAHKEGHKKIDFVQKIEEVLAKFPTLQYDGFIDSMIYFKITENIILKEINQKAGLDLMMDMGRFSIVINLCGPSVFARCDEGQTNLSGYVHPHITQSGSICLGDQTTLVIQSLQIGDLAGAIERVLAVMMTYNPGNPYVRLGDLFQKQRLDIEAAHWKSKLNKAQLRLIPEIENYLRADNIRQAGGSYLNPETKKLRFMDMPEEDFPFLAVICGIPAKVTRNVALKQINVSSAEFERPANLSSPAVPAVPTVMYRAADSDSYEIRIRS